MLPFSKMRARSAGKRSATSVQHLAHGRAGRGRPRAGPRRRACSVGGMRTVVIGGAELHVVDVLGDRRVVPADRALGIATDRDLGERGRERVEEQQPPDQRVADAERQLERLVRLQRADHAGQHAEDAALGAARRQLGRRRLREQAAVARALVRLEDRRLALEAEDRAVHDRDRRARRPRRSAGSGWGSCRPRRRSRPIPAPRIVVDVLRGEPLLDRDDLDVRVELLERAPRRSRLRLAEARGRVQHLALEIRLVHDVVVDDARAGPRPRPRGTGPPASRGRRRRSAACSSRAASAGRASPTSGIRKWRL